MKRIAIFLFLILSVITCFAQTQVDPTYQIQWNKLSGPGAPSITCTQNGNYTVYPYGAEWGQPYQDTTNNVEYKCSSSGWVENISGGGTAGYLPVWTGTTALGNSVIDQDVTTAGQVTVADGFTVNAIGTENIQMNTGAGQNIVLNPGQTFEVVGGTPSTTLVGIYGAGQVRLGNYAGTLPSFVNSTNYGHCDWPTGFPYETGYMPCGTELNGGVEISNPLLVTSYIAATNTIMTVNDFDTITGINSKYGLTVAYMQGSPGATTGLLVCPDTSGHAQTCPIGTSTWEGISTGAFWNTSDSEVSVRVVGFASCTFDNTPAGNDYVTPSSTTAGECHDNGTTLGAPLVGKVMGGSISGSTASVELYSLGPQTSSGGGGGFSNPMTTLGDVIYGGASGAATRLAGNTTTTPQCLIQTGTGSASAAPTWGSCASGSSSVSQIIAGTNVTISPTGGTGAVTINASGGSGAIHAQITVGTTSVPANSCLPTATTYSTATMTGVTTSMVFTFGWSANYSGVSGWTPATPGLYFTSYPTANTLNYQVCNATSTAIVPGSSTIWNVSAQ